MKKERIVKSIIIILVLTGPLLSQEIRDEESINYTYLGPTISFGYNQVEYTDWLGTETGTKKMSGYIVSGGAALNIFADEFCGDFQIKYSYSALDYSIMNMEFGLSGKYYYPFNTTFSLGAGLGVYVETPPSNRSHDGSGGIQLPLSLLFTTGSSTKLFFDVYGRYGTFGIGENSSSISAGINAGFIFKVGRI